MNFSNQVMLFVLFVFADLALACHLNLVYAYSNQSARISVQEQTNEESEKVPELHFIEKWTLESDPMESLWSFHLLRAKEDEAGNLYLADNGNNRMIKLSSSRKMIWIKGHAGHEPGQFLGLLQIDAFGGNVFVQEGWNKRIQVLRNDGSVLFLFDTNEYHFSDFAAGAENLVYIADIHAEKLISVFDINGDLVETFGKRPTGHLLDVESHSHNLQVRFDVDTLGNTYLVVYANQYQDPKLRKYNAARHLEHEIKLDHSSFSGGIRDLIVGKDNHVYVVSGDNQTGYSFDSDLTLRSKLNLSVLAKEGYTFFVNDIDADGNVLITSFSHYGETSVSKLNLRLNE